MKIINATILEEIIKEELFRVLEGAYGAAAAWEDPIGQGTGEVGAPEEEEETEEEAPDPRLNIDPETGIKQPTRPGFSRIGPGADPRSMPGVGERETAPGQEGAVESGRIYTTSGPLATVGYIKNGDNSEMFKDLSKTFSQHAISRAFERPAGEGALVDRLMPNSLAWVVISLGNEKVQDNWIKENIKGQRAQARQMRLHRKVKIKRNVRAGAKRIYNAQALVLNQINNLEPTATSSASGEETEEMS
jgi:hypothetical protein